MLAADFATMLLTLADGAYHFVHGGAGLIH